MTTPEEAIAANTKRIRRRAGIFAVLVVAVISITATLSRPHSANSVVAGRKMPPFAVPLALGSVNGDANVATRPDSGSAGNGPACAVRGQGILNICQLYERGPVVLALFVNLGSCAGVLGELQRLASSFHEVRFVGVAIKGDRGELRSLVRAQRLALPVGYDHDGVLAGLYGMLSCPELVFAYPGGVVAGKPLLGDSHLATLRSRVSALVATARARGWRPATT